MRLCTLSLVAAAVLLFAVSCSRSDGASSTPSAVAAGGGEGDGGTRRDNGDAGAGADAAGSAGSSAGTDGSAGAAGSDPAVSKPDDCPTDLPGPTLVRLATPEGTTYCMDRTEVTQKHYASFLAAVEATPAIKDDVKGQPAFCANGFELLARNAEGTDDSIPYCPGSLFDPGKTGDHPVVCVGPCAARAYCQWAGKELCGAPLGGASDMGSAISPAQSAWYNACTNGGQTKVAVEGGVSSGKCTVSGPQGAPHRSVEADAACHSDVEPFSQIVNLGGGVVEWEDSCDASGCLTRGARIVGSATTEEESCDDVGVRGGAIEYVGLRCCKPLAQR